MKKILIIFFSVMISTSFISCSTFRDMIEKKDVVKIGSKGFTEQYILGELMAQVVENEGISVERVFGMNGIKLIHDSLVNGRIDTYPEYTGSALMYILKKDILEDGEDVYNTVKESYKEFELVWLEPSKADNKSVLVTTIENSKRYNLKNFSDISAKSKDLVFCAPGEFWERKDGIEYLNENYGGFKDFRETVKMDMGLQYKALIDGAFDVCLGNNTDGQIEKYNLIILEDDKNIWPSYYAAPVVRNELLEKYPQLEKKFNALFSLLTTEVMKELNKKVDGDENMDAEDVAKEFLKANGLLGR
ncbi:glycine betaine ABC transporter substrate-binding protein [Clostridium sediminicola]|uniref:ABC transporter substrate-binding protein n=1 Tax=Clostridium sediminicola TaxID=3114879 RepID=UPI0031F1D78C